MAEGPQKTVLMADDDAEDCWLASEAFAASGAIAAFMCVLDGIELMDADGVGEVGNPVCGDMMAFYIKGEGDRPIDVKYKTFGCVAAISVSSMVSEMA